MKKLAIIMPLYFLVLWHLFFYLTTNLVSNEALHEAAAFCLTFISVFVLTAAFDLEGDKW